MLRSHTGTPIVRTAIRHEPTQESPEVWEERLYECPRCCVNIGRTCHSHYMFGHSTILQSNQFPKFCPNCGLMLDYSNEDIPDKYL